MSHTHIPPRAARFIGTAVALTTASLIAGSVGAPAIAAAAAPGSYLPASGKDQRNGPPGDNGTVKVHNASTSAELRKNEPHVCAFYLVGSGFDPEQEVTWDLLSWPPTGEKKVVSDGTLTLDGEGHGRTEDLTLPDGHYKLDWDFDGKNGSPKHKTFWVDCGDDENGEGEEPSPIPGPTGDATAPPSETAAPEPDTTHPGTPEPEETEPDEAGTEAPGTPEGTPAEDAPEQEETDPEETAPGEAGGGLPVTGAALTGLVSAAVIALGGGGTAMYVARKRKSGSVDES